LKYFREIKSEAEKIKLLGIVQEKAENQNQ
jgi:hypothetical protein